ncbi:hypothetical protein [Streptomyces sp. NPDC048639]|uniref:hypothetical protein n=1 Tax=Streptomyces sp. NPDC048639 TaxID=3365581 RepID=UPI0037193947
MLSVVVCVVSALALADCGVGLERPTKRAAEARDISQKYFYATLHPATASPGSDTLPLRFDHDGTTHRAEIAVDASGLDGVAVIAGAADGCKPHEPSFTCSLTIHDGWAEVALIVHAAPGARAGDSGVLHYTLKPEGQPAVKGRLTVIAGRPELRVNERGALRTSSVGKAFGAPIFIRNTGDVPARGVELQINASGGLNLTTRHANCRYSKGSTAARCLLPDTIIAPGETVRVTPEQRWRPHDDAVDPSLSYGAWAFHTGDGAGMPGELTRGDAASLSLTPVPARSEPVEFSTGSDLTRTQVPVRNDSDYEAIGASLRGEVGSDHRVRIGYRNNGPGRPQEAEIRTVFTIPPGAKVMKAPYDAELEEEMLEQECRAEGGGRRYICSRNGRVGEDVLFEFTLRVMRKDSRPGSVGVSGRLIEPPKGSRIRDPEPDNNKAVVQSTVAREGEDRGVRIGWVAATGALTVLGLTLFITARRRRVTG